MCRKIHLLHAIPKIWNYLKYRCLKRKSETSVQRYSPQICTVNVTPRCNLNCAFCCAMKIRNESMAKIYENEASLEKIKQIFENPLFAKCILVDLSGGEPLLIKDLNDIVSYLVKRGHIINLITNGVLLSGCINGLKQAGISRINVSLYDTNWSIIKRDITQINEVFPVHVSMVLTRSKLEEDEGGILEMVRFIRNAGCIGFRFFVYRPMGINPKQEETIDDTVPAYIKFRKIVEDEFPDFCIFPTTFQAEKVKKLCPQLWQRIGCDMLGNVMPCCGIDTVLQGPKSNLFNNEPDIVYNHPMLVDMREKLLDVECEPPDVCKTCNLLSEPGW